MSARPGGRWKGAPFPGGGVLGRRGGRRLGGVSLGLAAGRGARGDGGEAGVAVNGDSVPGGVVLGGSGDVALLGLTALEQLGLAVDPVQRRLVPADFLLY